MPSPELSGEVGRAGLWTMVGMGLLKLGDALLRRADRRRGDALAEIDATVHAGAVIREELRKEIERRDERIVTLETRNDLLERRVDELEKTEKALETRAEEISIELADAKAELRAWKRAGHGLPPRAG